MSVNSLMLLIERLQMMIETKMNSLLETFKDQGGFTEALTRERLGQRNLQSAEEGAPNCPECGSTMYRRITKKGIRQGESFWGCSNYPSCKATIPINNPN